MDDPFASLRDPLTGFIPPHLLRAIYGPEIGPELSDAETEGVDVEVSPSGMLIVIPKIDASTAPNTINPAKVLQLGNFAVCRLVSISTL